MTVTLNHAQAHLAELIGQLIPGEEIVITQDEKPIARLIPETKPTSPKKTRLGDSGVQRRRSHATSQPRGVGSVIGPGMPRNVPMRKLGDRRWRSSRRVAGSGPRSKLASSNGGLPSRSRRG